MSETICIPISDALVREAASDPAMRRYLQQRVAELVGFALEKTEAETGNEDE